ncbi:MAG: NAD(+)/NADH kinase [Candidatus Woesearchaeota archaeon]|nr:MAG: NAD(+)/NADH kinase [Candidatus Woesearchaeota archaeon]
MIELYCIKDKVPKKEYEIVDSLINKYKINQDVVVALGGDGTFLDALKRYDKPVLLIGKSTSLAFHADNKVNDLEDCLEKLIEGEFKVEEVNKLDVYLNKKNIGVCVNDYYAKTGKTIDYEIDFHYDKFRARGDGFIVFTPFGSSGYNRAVGGPKIDFRSKVIGISQVATCSLNDPLPYIIPEDQPIEIEIKRGIGRLYLDGEEPIKIKEGDKIYSELSDKKGKIIRINPKTISKRLFQRQLEFYQRLE